VPTLPRSSCAARSPLKPSVALPSMLTTCFDQIIEVVMSLNWSICKAGPQIVAEVLLPAYTRAGCCANDPAGGQRNDRGVAPQKQYRVEAARAWDDVCTSSPGRMPARAAGLPSSDASTISRRLSGSCAVRGKCDFLESCGLLRNFTAGGGAALQRRQHHQPPALRVLHGQKKTVVGPSLEASSAAIFTAKS